MEMPRIYNIVLTSLASKKLVLEEELERVINSDMVTEEKVGKIQSLLKEIIENDMMVSKWQGYLGKDNNENKK